MKKIMCFVMANAVAFCSAFPTGMTVLAAEQEQTDVSGEIEVLMNQSYDAMYPYIEGFEQKYPDAEVNFTYYSDYENEVAQRIQAGNYGDVLLIPGSVPSGDYDKYFEPLGSYQEFNVKYNFMEQSKFKGDIIYGIPSFAYLSGIAYNREVFDEAGITKMPDNINEFIADMQLIKEHTDAIPLYTNYNYDWAMTYWETFPYIEMTGNAGYRYGTFLYTENPFQSGSTHYKVYGLLYDLAALGCIEDNVLYSDWEESKTMLKVLERFKDATYVELTLVTGRTHQIRVHLKSINHPVYNDSLYGAGQGKVKTDEQVLQSYFLSFTKPFGDEIIELQIEPDEKIQKVLKYLRS